MNYVPGSKITKEFGISNSTLQKWANLGKVQCVRTPGGKRLYDYRSIESIFGKKETTRTRFCYTRVSSIKQKEDLERQRQLLHAKFPSHQLVGDIGSGLNYNRPGLKRILGCVMRGEVEELVVDYRDRLCKYGFELVEQMCSAFNTRLVVLYNSGGCESGLEEDLLSIGNYYVAKNGDKRAPVYRHPNEGTTVEENLYLPYQGTKANAPTVDKYGHMDLRLSYH